MADEIRHQEHGQFKAKLDELDDLKFRVQEVDETVSLHSARIQSIEQWRSGNGARGAEFRLQKLEDKFPEIESTLEAVKMIADAKIEKVIHGVLDARAKTAIELIKAFGPLAGMIASLAVALIALAGGRV